MKKCGYFYVLIHLVKANSFSIHEVIRNDSRQLLQEDSSSKVELNVYYESLCPDSIEFFRSQLRPALSQLTDIFSLNLIPYGKAFSIPTSEGGYEFECQHGEEECLGNMVHACSIQHVTPNSSLLPFIFCMMLNEGHPLSKGLLCAQKYDIHWGDIEGCVRGIEGQNLLAEHGEKTRNLRPSFSFVPTIELNKKQKGQLYLLYDLVNTVCQEYNGPSNSCSQNTL